MIILQVTISTTSTVALTLQKFHFLSQNAFEKNRTSISNAPQYFRFCLVIRYKYCFDTITHFSTISYPSIQSDPLVL